MISNNKSKIPKYHKEQLEAIEAIRKSAGILTSGSGFNYVKKINNLIPDVSK